MNLQYQENSSSDIPATMAMPDEAQQSCDKLLNLLRASGLNFLIQKTPYSAFVTIRKSFCREPKKFLNNTVDEVIDEKLKFENEKLQTTLEDREFELRSCKEDVETLQTKLENAENEMLNHIKNSKAAQNKLEENIADLISEKKKNDELISTLKSKSTNMLKSNEKNNP